MIDPLDKDITSQDLDDGYKDNTPTNDYTHTDIEINMHIHTFMNLNNKLYQLFINILKFILSLFVIFYPTLKKANQNDILHVYPYHSGLDQGALMDWGSN